MRINGNAASPVTPANAANAANPAQAPGGASPNGRSSKVASGPLRAVEDQVHISNLAAQLAANPAKLAQLQAAHEAGTYLVSPSQIANSIINAHLVKA